MRKLASIRIVDDVLPIENADRLEQVIIGGWRVVTQKGEFKKGDRCVYFEIDSGLPSDDSRYEFLKDRCLKRWMNHEQVIAETIRIKTIKLRGVVSQGLVMPLKDFPELSFQNQVGEDLTELLRVEHFDEIAERCQKVQGTARISGNAKGSFPSHLVPKTDEERLQNLVPDFERLSRFKYQETEKADGSSFTVIYAPIERPEDPFFVCSRNLEIKDESDNIFWTMARKFSILDKLKAHCESWSEFVGQKDEYIHQAAIQMELVGPGVNGNKDNLLEHSVKVFRMFDISKQQFYDPDTCECVVETMRLPHVKIIHRNWDAFAELKNIEGFLEHVKGKTDNGNEREGSVFKAWDKINNIIVSFKVINNDYLLKEK